MRYVIPLLVVCSTVANLGCGSGSGITNAPPVDASKARGGGGLAGDDDPGPPAGATTGAQAGSVATSRPARPQSSSQDVAADEASGSTTASAAAAKTPPQRPQSSVQNFASDEDSGPPPSSAAAAAAKTAAARPQSSAQNFASDEDSGPPPSSAGAAEAKAAPQRPQSSAQNLASDGDDFDSPSSSTPTSPSARPAAKGRGKATAAGGFAGSAAEETGDSASPESNENVGTDPSSLMDQATKSFDKFEEDEATQHLYGHWLTDAKAMDEYPLQWVTGINEPRILFRWGVGVVYDAPDDYSDRPPLIGDTNESSGPATGRTVRGAKGGGRVTQAVTNIVSPYDGVDRNQPFGNLLFYTGDFGERLVKRLDSRRLHKDFYYGKILGAVKFTRDEVADTAAPVVTQRENPGRLSMATEGDGEGVEATPNRVQSRAISNDSSSAATDGTLIPGVFFLGVETDSDAEKNLLETGKEAGVDAVLIFYVSVKSKSRSSEPFSSTGLGVHNLKTGDVQKTGTLSSATVAKTREREKDEDKDPVEMALDKIFKDYSDDKFRLSAMPEIKPEMAMKRVDALIAENHANPLPIVVEILSYHKAGLLDGTATVAALAKVLGGDEAAQKMLTGNSEEKLAVVKKWLPSGAASPSQSDSDFR